MSVLHCQLCNTAVHDVKELPDNAAVVCVECGHVLRPASPTAALPLPPSPSSVVAPPPSLHLPQADDPSPRQPRHPTRVPWASGVAAAALALALTAGVVGLFWVTATRPAGEPPAPSLPTHEDRGTEWAGGCVLVEASDPHGRTRVGTGWLVDRDRRLVFTVAQVVDGAATILVHFPATADGGRVTNPEAYLNGLSTAKGHAATVEAAGEGPKNGVALLRLADPPPPGVPALPLAAAEPSPTAGQPVRVSGLVGGVLWQTVRGELRTGAVRQVVRLPAAGEGSITLSVEAKMRDVRVDTLPGDSGGPVVTAGGRVVGMVIARGREPGTLVAVDLSELHAAVAAATGPPPVAPLPLADRPLDEVVRLAKSDTDTEGRVRAAVELGRRKDRATGALPALVDLLTTEPEPRAADAIADALDYIGPPADGGEALLEKAVRSDNRRLKMYALRQYASRPAGGDALAAVVKLVSDRSVADQDVRTAAVVALGMADPAAARRADAFSVLLDAADDRDPKMAEAAAAVFERFARDAAFGKADLTLLRKAVNCENPRVVRAAAVAAARFAETAKEAFALCPVGLLAGEDAEFLAALILALARWPVTDWPAGYWEAAFGQITHPNKAVRLAVLKAIRELKVDTGVARRVVWLAENDKDADVKAAALLTFARLNVTPGELGAKEHADLLRRLLESENGKAMKAARPTLRRQPGVDDPLDVKVSAAYTAMFTRDVGEKVAVIDRLAGLGAAAEPATVDLLALLTDHPSVAVKAAALRALTKLSPANDSKAKQLLAERLLAVLTGKAGFAVPLPEECLASAELAKELGPRADTADEKEVMAVTVKLISPSALDALISLGDEAVEPLAELVVGKGTGKELRELAVSGLARLGPKARPATPRLVAQAAAEPDVRAVVGDAVAKIGGDEAVGRLRKCTDFSRELEQLPRNRDPERAALRAWAYSVLAEIDLTTLTSDGRKQCLMRLETAVKYEVDATCKEVATRGLERQQERTTRLKLK